MTVPSAEAPTVAATIFGGKLAGGCGSVLATTPVMVSSSSVVPDTGSSSRKSVAVTTKARPSIPKATPSGALPKAKVCLPEVLRSITVTALFDEAGGAALPKCVTTRKRLSGERASELGCAATLIEVWIALFDSDMTSIRFAVKFAMYRTPLGSSSARLEACPPIDTTVPNVPPHAAAASAATRLLFHQ